MSRFVRAAGLALLLCIPLPAFAASLPATVDAAESARLAAEVRQEFLHAWQGYKRYAWGHDDLAPLSRKPHDWYAKPLLMTPVDALDTLVVMGLKDEADAARELIATRLDLDQDIYVKNFEITIRLLGGLLSGYQLTGDERLLHKAEDLGTRLLPVFDSPTGLPYVEVNLHTGKTRGTQTNPAETGTLLLEFGTLARLTGKPVFYDKAKRALVETWKRRSTLDLVGASIDVESGRWLDPESSIAGGIDSYDEYLWKCWRLFGDPDCLAMWKPTIAAANKYLADDVDGALWYGYADMNSGRRTHTNYGALDAFFPALLALSGDVPRAARLQDSSFAMWQLEGIEPEVYDYRARKISYQGYALRPEIVESTYYLSHYTRDPKYLAMGRAMLHDFVKYCRTDSGYAALANVTTKQKKDRMESFLFAETFKYYYLLFAPQAIDFDAVTFNTEAHPLRATWNSNATSVTADAAAWVEPRIGSAHGGNTFPGAVVPFGMLAFSPETTRGDHSRVAAPGGYAYDATKIRGFSLTHLSGTGCRGASGDIPLMPITFEPTTSPSADAKDALYANSYSHVNEHAEPGYYAVALDNRVRVELTATARSGAARLRYPSGVPAALLIRTSDSETGSSAADVAIDAHAGVVRGSVSSGNFCGYLDAEDRRSYYTLYFVAAFDRPIAAQGTWENARLTPGGTHAKGGTGYGKEGFAQAGLGSGAWLRFDTAGERTVGVRVGISYVSLANAQANLDAENAAGTRFDDLRSAARASWNDWLSRIGVDGGSDDQKRMFYTALYHSLQHPNLFSDANGEYAGFDGQAHRVAAPQGAQYANFSGWDIYRSQIQLVTLLDPNVGSDIAQSLLNQANQNHGVWDRWTHNTGATHVMNGDPSAAAIASIHAFGGTAFDTQAALASLLRAATTPTPLDLDQRGCPIECVGQRPGLDQWQKLGYIPAQSHAWGAAAEMLEQAAADFALAAFAGRLGDSANSQRLLERSGSWRQLFNPKATPTGGYLQNRNADGSWPAFEPATEDGFVEGSAAQYLWMLPFDARGLFDALGGDAAATARLDAFFHDEDGAWALTGLGGLHAELDNEPSLASPWLYLYAGQPWKTQATVREVLNTLWKPTPDGIPGNDDLGEMSSWYVWSALGLYPLLPGRAELMIGSPLFTHALIRHGERRIRIDAAAAATDAPYVHALEVDGHASTRAWLPADFITRGGNLEFELSKVPSRTWASAAEDRPPAAMR
ncbi:MAG TPA: GH92 family glycosyl hydrolase [Dokdonella sp.]